MAELGSIFQNSHQAYPERISLKGITVFYPIAIQHIGHRKGKS